MLTIHRGNADLHSIWRFLCVIEHWKIQWILSILSVVFSADPLLLQRSRNQNIYPYHLWIFEWLSIISSWNNFGNYLFDLLFSKLFGQKVLCLNVYHQQNYSWKFFDKSGQSKQILQFDEKNQVFRFDIFLAKIVEVKKQRLWIIPKIQLLEVLRNILSAKKVR